MHFSGTSSGCHPAVTQGRGEGAAVPSQESTEAQRGKGQEAGVHTGLDGVLPSSPQGEGPGDGAGMSEWLRFSRRFLRISCD